MLTLAEFPYWFIATLAVCLGLAFGSFLNVVIYRLPREQSILRPGSNCPACSAPIRAYDNIPVVSWLLLRGRARCCGARISARYPLIELAGGLLAWAILQRVVLELDARPLDGVAAALVLHSGLFASLLQVVDGVLRRLPHLGVRVLKQLFQAPDHGVVGGVLEGADGLDHDLGNGVVEG